jgi:hypothetical protein
MGLPKEEGILPKDLQKDQKLAEQVELLTKSGGFIQDGLLESLMAKKFDSKFPEQSPGKKALCIPDFITNNKVSTDDQEEEIYGNLVWRAKPKLAPELEEVTLSQ